MNRPIPLTVVQDSGESLYAAQPKVYPREIDGRFARLRIAAVFVLLGLFYLLPWIRWDGHQAVLFDLPARKFYVFGLTFWPQDFFWLACLLMIAAITLFFFTALAGRLWCGYACPQTVWTEVFLWIERFCEGRRNQRIKLDGGSWTRDKILRKSAKQFLWITLSLWTGFTFVGFFTPILDLGHAAASLSFSGWEGFWVVFYGFATYGNAGYMREQVCKYMCPYARFQSAMFDRDTLIVSYDTARGEPRGSRSRKADPAKLSLGACIDCDLCVHVCPTGIDIRKGLQYECIGCGGCVDVCNTVMDKMNYPRGLIRFSTQNAITKGWTRKQIWGHILRPRVLLYSTVLLSLCFALSWSLFMRTPLRVDVVRDRGTLSRIVEGGRIENVYRLQVMNATEQPQEYKIAVEGIPGIAVASDDEVKVGAAESRWVAVRLQVPYDAAPPGSHPIHFNVSMEHGDAHVSEKSVFLVPR